MEDIQATIIIPHDIENDIKWYLKNYNNLDKKINMRKKEIKDRMIDYYHFSKNNYYKSISGIGNTVEDAVIYLDEDFKVTKYSKWKNIIKKFMQDKDNKNDYLKYWIIRYFYFENKNENEVINLLNMSFKEFDEKVSEILLELYIRALNEKIYKEVS